MLHANGELQIVLTFDDDDNDVSDMSKQKRSTKLRL